MARAPVLRLIFWFKYTYVVTWDPRKVKSFMPQFPHPHARVFTTTGNPAVSISQFWDYRQALPRPALYVGARDANMGLHAYAPSTVSTKPSSN